MFLPQVKFVLATMAGKSRTLLAAGLLMATGLLANGAPPARAQMQEPCPVPAGITPPQDPSVTAQDVQEGASQRDFALAVRERSVEHAQSATATEEGLYIYWMHSQAGHWNLAFR